MRRGSARRVTLRSAAVAADGGRDRRRPRHLRRWVVSFGVIIEDSHFCRRRSSPSTSGRTSPATTRNTSWFDSAWYRPPGLPGSSTVTVNPSRRPWLRLGLEPGAAPHPVLAHPSRFACVDDVPASRLRGQAFAHLHRWRLLDRHGVLTSKLGEPVVPAPTSTILRSWSSRHRSSSTATPATTTRSRCSSRSASPEIELLGVTTTYGNQTLEKTTANTLRVLELAGRNDVAVAVGAAAPLERELVVAAHVHGESGLDGPALPSPGSGGRRRRGRVDRRRVRGRDRAGHARPDRAADEHRPLPRRCTGRTGYSGSC